MSFASKYRGKELTVMVKLLSVFGVVEVRQMRELFSHLDTKKYGKIMTLLHREGMVYTTPDAKYLASNRMSAAKVDISSSVSCFWALISIKDSIQDFCAGEMPALLTVSATGFDYDLIPVSEKALSLPSLGGGFLRLGTEDDLLVQSNAKLLQMDGSLERRLKSAEAALEPYQQYL